MQGGPSHHDKPLINILAWPKAVATLITVGMVRMKDFLYLFGSGLLALSELYCFHVL